MSAALLLAAAGEFGFPRVEVPVPGRRSPVPVDPDPDAWSRFASRFASDPGALEAALRELVYWECCIRGELAPQVAHA